MEASEQKFLCYNIEYNRRMFFIVQKNRKYNLNNISSQFVNFSLTDLINVFYSMFFSSKKK